MKQILFPLFLVVAVSIWCTPSFATPETIGTTGSPWPSDATGSADGYFINNGGTAYTLDVTAGFPDIYTANLGGPYTNPAVDTNNANLSNIVFSSNGTSNVYGTIGATATFADITMTGTTSVNFYGTVNTTTMHIATGTADFLSGTSNNNSAITFTGDGTVNIAPNTTVIGAITNQGADQGTLVLGSASELNGAVGGATGLKAINVVGGNNIAGVSATISGAVNTYAISLLTNTLNIGGALTIAPNGVIDTIVASSTVYGKVVTTGSVTIGTGTVIDETIEGSASFIPALSIVSNYTSPITIESTIENGGTLGLNGSNQAVGSLNGSSGSTINLGANTLTTGSLGTTDSYAGTISGTGGLTVDEAGSGSLTLSGDNNYSGETIIEAGTLQVSNASALGTGAGGVTVDSAGTLALGTTNLNIGSGTYTQTGDATLTLSANSPSSYGSITTTGGALTNSANTVDVAVGGYLPNNSVLSIINTGTGITGTAPSTVNTFDDSRVSFTSSIVGDNLILTANHSTSGFASLANNANARAAGNVLDNETNPSSDMTNVLNTLEFSSNTQTSSSLNSMGPIVDGGILESNTVSLNNFIGASLERAQNVLTLASSGNSDSTGVSSGDVSPLNSLWAKQYGGYLDQGTRDGIEGYNAWNTGTAVGLDHMFTDNLTIGASLGYAYSQVDSDVNNASTDINSAEATLYAAYQGQAHPYFIDAAGSFANNWYDGQRDISVSGINRTADSDYQGQQSGIYLDGGYKFDLGNNLVLTPLTSLQWTHLAIDSYTESNAGAMDLMVNRQSYNILESGLGASIAYPVKCNWGNVTPEIHAKWLYDYIDDNMVVTSAFTGGGAAFTSTGASPARNGANIGGKLSFDFNNDISLIAGIDTEIKDNFFGVFGSVALRYKF